VFCPKLLSWLTAGVAQRFILSSLCAYAAWDLCWR